MVMPGSLKFAHLNFEIKPVERKLGKLRYYSEVEDGVFRPQNGRVSFMLKWSIYLDMFRSSNLGQP